MIGNTSVYYLAICYAVTVLQEYIHYWYVYLMLSLPPRLFGIVNPEVSFAPDEEDRESRRVWIIVVKMFLAKTPKTFECESLSGTQLLLLADDQGRIPINLLQEYYPTIDTLYIQYIDLTEHTQVTQHGGDGPSLSKYSTLSRPVITKVIDVATRTEIRTGKKCRFGQICI